MKNIVVFIIGISLLFISCKDKSTEPTPTTTYTQMLFDREGGGNIVFTAIPKSSKDTLQVVVTKYTFQDTTIQMDIPRNSTSTGLFDTLTQALSGQIQVTGSFIQDTMAIVGTWAYVYMVNGNDKMQVTNVALRNTMLQLELIVKAKL
jgi:hypothetical protein